MIYRFCCPLVLSLLLASSLIFAASPVLRLEVIIEDDSRLRELSSLVSVDDVKAGVATVYVLTDQLPVLEGAGFAFREAPISAKAEVRMCAEGWADLAEPTWDCYPTYSQYEAMMQRLAASRPEICSLLELGTTANQLRPHRILALKITANPDVEEIEPEVFLTSSMHGDETGGFAFLLRMAFELSAAYGVDPWITELVDRTEIWINPLANPDGTYFAGDETVSGAIRFHTTADGHATAVDQNRNYPDRFIGRFPSGYFWWPETEAMMAFAASRSIVLSANLHGGAELVNYPWDSSCETHPDENWFRDLSLAWAEAAQQDGPSGYLDDCPTPRCSNSPCTPGVTNGADWYLVNGGRQDFMTYFHGGRELTVEMSREKLLATDSLETLWQANRRAALDFVGAAQRGIHGKVTDSLGVPLAATVFLLGIDDWDSRSWSRTDADIGDFHRLTLPGTYDLAISSPGFDTTIIEDVEVSEPSSWVFLDVRLSARPTPMTAAPVAAR